MTRRGRRVGCYAATLAFALALVSARTDGQVADPSQRDAAAPITLSIVGTNDLHGGVLPVGERGGLALLAGYVKNLRAARARDGGGVLLIDAGRYVSGNDRVESQRRRVVIDAYNALGYTAAAIGNHEFDFGAVDPAATGRASEDDLRGDLKAIAARAKFPILAANLLDSSTGQSVDWRNVSRRSIVETAGIKVGIIGVMTVGALGATHASNTRGLSSRRWRRDSGAGLSVAGRGAPRRLSSRLTQAGAARSSSGRPTCRRASRRRKS